ncbi:MAG TPA: hypothetical protein VK548_16335 [Candidatus Acidoferrum sp.]|nr:hypothetical protein [Candidatus Acidoferrum sp.]
MSTDGRRVRAWLVVLAASLLVSGCAVQRIENGVYHSSKGYRVAIPTAEWTLVDAGPADLTLRHHGSSAGMAVNAVCEGAAPRRAADVLARQLHIGLRDRLTIERATTEVAGRPASRVVAEGRLEDSAKVRIESLSMTDERCLYDFLYVAPPAAFDAARADFATFVGSFQRE